MTQEQKLFELVDSIGETLRGKIHVIDINVDYPEMEGERKYRVYHSKGYCLNIERIAIVDDQTGDFKEWDYVFFCEWDGFDKIDAKGAIKLINSQK